MNYRSRYCIFSYVDDWPLLLQIYRGSSCFATNLLQTLSRIPAYKFKKWFGLLHRVIDSRYKLEEKKNALLEEIVEI